MISRASLAHTRDAEELLLVRGERAANRPEVLQDRLAHDVADAREPLNRELLLRVRSEELWIVAHLAVSGAVWRHGLVLARSARCGLAATSSPASATVARHPTRQHREELRGRLAPGGWDDGEVEVEREAAHRAPRRARALALVEERGIPFEHERARRVRLLEAADLLEETLVDHGRVEVADALALDRDGAAVEPAGSTRRGRDEVASSADDVVRGSEALTVHLDAGRAQEVDHLGRLARVDDDEGRRLGRGLGWSGRFGHP